MNQPRQASARGKLRSYGAMTLAGWLLCASVQAAPRQGMASWYSRASTIREGNSGVMANGQKMQDTAFTAASLDYGFGTRLKICQSKNTRCGDQNRQQDCTTVVVTDRGPNLRLYRQGRILDLSPAAFAQLADLKEGIIPITVEEVGQP